MWTCISERKSSPTENFCNSSATISGVTWYISSTRDVAVVRSLMTASSAWAVETLRTAPDVASSSSVKSRKKVSGERDSCGLTVIISRSMRRRTW